MLKNIKMFGKKGFTLVELLVAMTIMAVLVSLALVAFQGSRRSARDAKRRTDLEQIRSALEMYRTDYGGVYPVRTGKPADVLASDLADYLVIPNDPVGGGSREYYYTSDGATYALCAALEVDGSSTSCLNNCGTEESCDYEVNNP